MMENHDLIFIQYPIKNKAWQEQEAYKSKRHGKSKRRTRAQSMARESQLLIQALHVQEDHIKKISSLKQNHISGGS
jgi:hypothetical protein